MNTLLQVAMEEIKRLYNDHGQKVWEMLSTVSKKNKFDQYRPQHLPKDSVVGRPKVRTSKPRPANPFRRRRNLGVNTMIPYHLP